MSAIFRIWTLCLTALAFSIPAHALQVSWAVAGDMANARFQHGATLLPSGKVLVIAMLRNSGDRVVRSDHEHVERGGKPSNGSRFGRRGRRHDRQH